MDKIDKAYGRGSIMKLGDDNVEDIDVIPTGSIGLDFALGVSAATESITMMSIAEERISWSAISRACSPLSGCEIQRLFTSTPSFSA